MNHLGKLDDPALLDALASKVADARRAEIGRASCRERV